MARIKQTARKSTGGKAPRVMRQVLTPTPSEARSTQTPAFKTEDEFLEAEAAAAAEVARAEVKQPDFENEVYRQDRQRYPDRTFAKQQQNDRQTSETHIRKAIEKIDEEVWRQKTIEERRELVLQEYNRKMCLRGASTSWSVRTHFPQQYDQLLEEVRMLNRFADVLRPKGKKDVEIAVHRRNDQRDDSEVPFRRDGGRVKVEEEDEIREDETGSESDSESEDENTPKARRLKLAETVMPNIMGTRKRPASAEENEDDSDCEDASVKKEIAYTVVSRGLAVGGRKGGKRIRVGEWPFFKV